MPEPYWADETVTLHLGKCEEVLPSLPAESVDAIVTDPPAAVRFMGREWDSDLGGRRQWVAWLADCMEKAARVLKPGGHLLVWSLPRTSHWTALALEDAGLEIRDCVLHLFGSGFPKSHDVAKALDKADGNPLAFREFARAYAAAVAASALTHADIDRHLGVKSSSCYWAREDHRGGMPPRHHWDQVAAILGLPARFERLYDEAVREVTGIKERGFTPGSNAIYGQFSGDNHLTAPATEEAARWEGWGTALKPGQEIWWLARKPLVARTVAANVLEWGTGALNIAGCKVGTEQRTNNAGGASSLQRVSRVEAGYRPAVTASTGEASEVTGRWPSNVVFTHDARCEPAGTRRVRNRSGSISPDAPSSPVDAVYGERERVGWQAHGDADGLETVEVWACAPGCPVAELDRQSGATVSRSGGLTTKALGVMNDDAWQARDVPRTGHDDTGGASRFYPVFRYQAKAPASERPRLDDGTAHETVKPLGLMRWLVRLITPPGGTVLDLFAGSGPTGEACIIEGFNCVLIEQDLKSCELIKTRLRKPIQPVMFGMEAS